MPGGAMMIGPWPRGKSDGQRMREFVAKKCRGRKKR